MPKPPNLTSSVAAIRNAMGMKLEDFAQFVGHGAAMLKQIEAGRKPMSDELADKIQLATGVSHKLLRKSKWTAKDRKTFTPNTIGTAAFGGPGIQEARLAPLRLLPDIMAIYFALLAEGVNPELALIPLRREIARTMDRWNINPERASSLRSDFMERLFAVRGDEQGKAKPIYETITNHLAGSKGYLLTQQLEDEWSRRFYKTWKAGPRMKPTSIFWKGMDGLIQAEKNHARSKRAPSPQ